ncbi:hypothetical protein P280DRAFT_409027 [Massarina eburnea CBS 473.64]|uniref:Transcriptional regulatory protein DEP1 n=1 Tax=Massarina eburnea CBS 473.64 TaxID=1395130 RepID=A0A6A6RND3_9PLEO|nr:hypothetical protein P280DRAFT_409027 [Massarina eburnea CBS 473.64]
MSALQRARRSTSKTAPDTASYVAAPAARSPQKSAPASLSGSTMSAATIEEAEMLTTLAAPARTTSEPQGLENGQDGFNVPADDRSSSLSELGDASDVESESTPQPTTAADLNDESEAETERLEITPRKLTRAATDTSLATEQVYHRTPSKLVHSKTIDDDDSLPPTPSFVVTGNVPPEPSNGNAALHALSLASEAASLAELAGKKRKRTNAETSVVEEVDEPARKRSSFEKESALNGSREGVADKTEKADAAEELDHAEERISQLAREEMDLEERQADIAVEAVSEMATVAKHTKPRKGGRRGKRKVEETIEAVASIEAQEGEGEGEGEDDNASLDEEVSRKKHAIDELAKIEKKFKLFREKLCDEQIAQFESELEMLKKPNCMHPEYLAMIKSIDERRTEKIVYEKQLLRFKQKNLEAKTIAERHQAHSQYFQTVRDVRERVLADCNQRIHELHRGRRQLGIDEVHYMMKLPEKRSDQIRHQAAYNLEVSILSGVAKYVGFPTAPDIRSARPSEIDDDLRAMKIPTRPAAVPVPPYVRPAYGRTSTADEAAAEGEFIENTPWANPQHPSHLARYGAGPGPSRAPNYHTPIGQRQIQAPNGSASTIEAVNSNPHSSSNPHMNNGRMSESESPVLQMKRHPMMDHPYADTPGSLPRNMSNLARDPYAMSSPAGPSQADHQHPDDQANRWGGMRPTPPSMPGRPDSSRVPMAAQRAGLGTVSVGSGNGLFGR